MILTKSMTQLFAVVLARHRESVTSALLREGVLHFLRTSEYDLGYHGQIKAARTQITLSEISDLRRRIEGILDVIGIRPTTPKETDLQDDVTIDLEEEKQKLDKLERERENIHERQRLLQQEILKLEDIQRQSKVYGLGLEGVSLPNKQSLLFMETGHLPNNQMNRFNSDLQGLPVLSIELGQEEDVTHVLLLAMKRDKDRVDTLLSGLSWNAVELPSDMMTMKKDLFDELDTKIAGLTKEQKNLQTQVNQLIEKQSDHLNEVWGSLRVQELCTRIQGHFQASERTVVFVGWLPSDKRAVLDRTIREASGNHCYLEWIEPGDETMLGNDIPVQLDNPKWLRPFQMLVSNFGIPPYGTIDPTLFVMPLYLAMFGLMFADVGQGLVLMALGCWSVRYYKKQADKEGLLQLAWLILWCGGSSTLFGALFGSYFGFPWAPPLWFNYHGVVFGHGEAGALIHEIGDILKMTIYFGITVIGLGLGFNWINLIRTHQWFTLVFDKGGLLGGWMYAGGIYTANYMAMHNFMDYPSSGVLFVLLGVPAFMFLLKEPLHSMQHTHSSDERVNPLVVVMNAFMEWVVELLEILSGYLSNTLSFMRLAGLGIAHVCLMESFATLAGMTGSKIFAILILLLGNMMVIGLEGLSAGIQALRLHYYEFFTKFFHGSGTLHTPIALDSRV